MPVRHRTTPFALWTLQWGTAGALCLLGALLLGLPPEELRRLGLADGLPDDQVIAAGSLLVVASAAMVVPSACALLPALSPATAAVLAAAIAAGGFSLLPRLRALPVADAALAGACAVVAIARAFAFRVPPARLRGEHEDPLQRPDKRSFTTRVGRRNPPGRPGAPSMATR